MITLLKEVAGRKLLYVMAAQQEYGPNLQARFKPLMTGVGPVEAAVQLTSALHQMQASDAQPDLVVSLGSAGSSKLEQTQIYQVSSVSYRDMDASPLGFEKGATPFLDMPVSMDFVHQIPQVPSATLSTGANIVSGDAYAQIDADMVDMETFALLRVCQHFDVPLAGLRGISDGKSEVRHIDNWTEYLHIIDEKLADTVDRLETAIGEGTFLPSS